jgi:16S rRNA (uracil1498-N3)-methyltransferase
VRVPRVLGSDLPDAPGARYLVDDEEATHLARVLRVRPGDAVEVFDGEGRAGRFVVRAAGRREVELELVARSDADPALPFTLTAAVATPKAKRAQRLVEGLCELGVAAWVPLSLSRCEGRPPRPDEVRRWAIEAAKQCGRNRLLEAAPPVDLAGLLALARAHDLALVGDTADATPLRDVLARPRPARALVVVGPEGGFTAEERSALRGAGLASVALGPTILRIETAAHGLCAALVAAWA